MTRSKRNIWVPAGLAMLALALLAYAWIDGGSEALREISVAVDVPGEGA